MAITKAPSNEASKAATSVAQIDGGAKKKSSSKKSTTSKKPTATKKATTSKSSTSSKSSAKKPATKKKAKNTEGTPDTESKESKQKYYRICNEKGDPAGRYTGTTPKQAASKAFTKLFNKRVKDGKGEPKGAMTLTVRESTRGSTTRYREHVYSAERVKLDKPEVVVINKGKGDLEKKIEYSHRNVLKKVEMKNTKKQRDQQKKDTKKKDPSKKKSSTSKTGAKKEKKPSSSSKAKKSTKKTK